VTSDGRKGTTNIKVNRKNIFDNLFIKRYVKTRIKYTQNLHGRRPEEKTLNLTAFKRLDTIDYDSSPFAPPQKAPFICS
jgi:hypothetical protein